MPRDPFSVGLQRLAASSGAFFVLLMIVAVLIQGDEPPDFGAPPEEYVTYAADNQSDVQASSLVLVLAAFQLVWFAGYLRGMLGHDERLARGFTRLAHIVFAGAIVAAVGLILTAVMKAAAVSEPDGTDPDVVRAFSHLGLWTFNVASVGFAATMYTATFLILRLRTLPVWLGWVGLAGGVAYLVTLLSMLDPADDGGAPGVAYPVGFVTLLVWTLALSVVFVRRVERPTSAAG